MQKEDAPTIVNNLVALTLKTMKEEDQGEDEREESSKGDTKEGEDQKEDKTQAD